MENDHGPQLVLLPQCKKGKEGFQLHYLSLFRDQWNLFKIMSYCKKCR